MNVFSREDHPFVHGEWDCASTDSFQPGYPFLGRCNEYQPKDGDAFWLQWVKV